MFYQDLLVKCVTITFHAVWAGRISALIFDLFNLGLNLDWTISCHPGVSHAWQCINVSAVHQMDVKPEDPSASIGCWWGLKIIWCLSKTKVSYHWHLEQITNSCPNQLELNIRPEKTWAKPSPIPDPTIRSD